MSQVSASYGCKILTLRSVLQVSCHLLFCTITTSAFIVLAASVAESVKQQSCAGVSNLFLVGPNGQFLKRSWDRLTKYSLPAGLACPVGASAQTDAAASISRDRANSPV